MGERGFDSAGRPPGYPFFLWVSGLLPGRLEDAAVVLQLCLGVAVAGAIVYFGWPLLGRGVALVAGGLAALASPSLFLESLLLADYLFGVMVLAGAGVLTAACLSTGGKRLVLLVLTGVVLAAACYVKPVGQALVVAPVLPLALATRSVGWTVGGTVLVAAVVVVCILPWMLRNEDRYGELTMSMQSGRTLVNRAFEDDKLPIPTDLEAGRVALELQREDPEGRLSSGLFNTLFERGATTQEADEMSRELALTAIRRHPRSYAVNTVRATRQMFTDVATGRATDDAVSQLAERSVVPTVVTRGGMFFADLVRRVWRILAVGGLVAVLWLVLSADRRARVAVAAVLGVWLSVAVATAALHGGQLRYSAALAPLVWLLGSIGLVVAVRLAAAAVRDPQGRAAVTAVVRRPLSRS